jgi:hypothetical protein
MKTTIWAEHENSTLLILPGNRAHPASYSIPMYMWGTLVGDKAVQSLQLTTHLRLMLKLWQIHSLVHIYVCAWDFPLHLGLLQPATGHLLGNFYSFPFPLNINFTAISLKDLYEIRHFLVQTWSTGNGNFVYDFNNTIMVVPWYSVFQFLSNRFLCWQCVCITWDFGFHRDVVELSFFSHIAAQRFGTTTHFRYGRYQSTFDAGQYPRRTAN